MENACGGVESQVQRIGALAGNINVLVQHDSGPGTPVASGCGTKLGERVIITASIPFKSVTGIIPAFSMSSVARRTIIKEVHLLYTLLPPGVATAIPQATNTPGPAPTATPEGTPPVDTPGPTPTTTGICNGVIEWSPSGSKSYMATFVNAAENSYTLNSITVTWENTDPTLNEVVYVGTGYDAITSLLAKSPATVEVNWVVGYGTSMFDFIFSQSNATNIGIRLNMEGPGGSCVTNPS